MRHFLIILSMLFLIAACSEDEPGPPDENVVCLRLTNHTTTVIDSIELRYQTSGPFYSSFLPALEPNDTSSFERIGAVNDQIVFRFWADGTTYDNHWFLPASFIDPASANSNRFPQGYYSFSVLQLIDSTNSATVGLIDFSLH